MSPDTVPAPIIPVILSGGSGTRLWPMSRKGYPKQFLPLVDHNTMFSSTLQRAMEIPGTQSPVVVANENHRFFVAEELRVLAEPGSAILLEPCARNTAPAVAAAARFVRDRHGDHALMLVLPADHVIQDVPAFSRAVEAGTGPAVSGLLVTFGIVPTRPETGYGYIRADRNRPIGDQGRSFHVAEFVEKPDAVTAQGYLDSGDYTWNSGMFLLRPGAFLSEMESHCPLIAEHATAALESARHDLDFIRLDPTAFAAAPSDSIDYAVMEHTDRAAVIALECGWNDVGAWSALWDLGTKDEAGNVVDGDVMTMDSSGSYVHSSHRLVATLGIQDLVIVETPDAVLVAHRSKVQGVKKIVDRLVADGRGEADLHREVHRPWGTYDCIDGGDRFKVKRITVNPGASLSLQKHYHRAEHWIVVKGTAEVTCDDRIITLTENQSTFIPLGSRHRLVNPGRVPLEMIEVQSGSYLGEDDIVRFEDNYGRDRED